MSYKPDEKDWMAYLYGELQGDEKERFEQFLLSDPEARNELARYGNLRTVLSNVGDKEVIAPPIVLGDNRQRFLWDAPYLKTIVSVAASLLLIIVAGRLAGVDLQVKNNELRLTFGTPPPAAEQPVSEPGMTPDEVQEMIRTALASNNSEIEKTLKQNEAKLTSSIRQNLALNSTRINELMQEASSASQSQIRDYVAGIQAKNMEQVKNYFQLTSAEQKDYIENLLVDFAEYLQQQRNNDLQLVQTRLNSIEQNTDIFKQETEQILTSIISNVSNPNVKETKN